MRNLFFITALMYFIFACSSRNEINPDSLIIPESEAGIDNLAKKLATNQERSSTILKEVFKKKANQSNSVLLFSVISNDQNNAVEGTSLSEIITKEFSQPNYRSQSIDFEELLNSNPFLEIALFKDGEEIQEFPGDNVDFLVAYEYEFGTKEFIKAYDKNGKMIKLDYWKAPKGFVLVIRENEQLIAVPKNDRAALKIKPKFQNVSSSIFYRQDYYYANNKLTLEDFENKINGVVGVEKSQSLSRSLRPMTCSRDLDNNKDRMNKFKVNSSAIFDAMKDGWFNSTLEIECDITIYSSYGILHLDRTWYPKEKDLKDLNWFNMGDVEVFNWVLTNFGDVVHYDFYEKDGNSMVPKTISFSTTTGNNQTVTANSTYEVAQNRYDLNNSLVQYCDASSGDGHLYNTSKIQFYVRHPF